MSDPVSTVTYIALGVSILSFLLGGGILIRLFTAGKTIGNFQTRLDQVEKATDQNTNSNLRKDLEDLSKVVASLKERVSGIKSDQKSYAAGGEERRRELSEKMTVIHRRLDEVGKSSVTNAEAIRGFVRDMTTLLSDVRELIKSNAVTESVVDSIKTTLTNIDNTQRQLEKEVAALKTKAGANNV